MSKIIVFRFFLILLALMQFFIGYFFAERKNYLKYQEEKKPLYLDIRTSKKNIEFENVPENIILRVNGAIFSSGSIELK